MPTIYRALRWSFISLGSIEMKIPSELKRLRARSLWSVVRFVVVMLRRRIAVKKLQRMVVDLHMKYFGGDKFLNINSIGGNFNDHHEFSCSSSPARISKAPSTFSIHGHVVNSVSRRKKWDGRFLLKALVPSCTGTNVKDDLESESDYMDFPQFIACNEDDDRYFSYMDPRFSNSNELTASDSCTYVSTTRCSNCSLSSEIDRQAEEFISSFYQQMRLQRQDP